MDTWTDVFTDSHGVKRCTRCQHARPTKNQDVAKVAVNTLADALKSIQEAAAKLKKQIHNLALQDVCQQEEKVDFLE